MKLRNKKTGEIIIPTDYTFATYDDGIKYGHYIYYSLAELNEEWEDYAPKEPLIKDEMVRSAVRMWANFNGTYPIYCEDRCTLSYDHSPRIEFKNLVFANLGSRAYTIAELCGEEEE